LARVALAEADARVAATDALGHVGPERAHVADPVRRELELARRRRRHRDLAVASGARVSHVD
jgi:hypothetical protein